MTIPTNRTLSTTKAEHLTDHNTMADAVNKAVPAATSFTTTTLPNPVDGGNMTVLVFPADTAALAIAVAGDAFPRFLMTSDITDGWYFGDGTFDPYGVGPNLFASATRWTVSSPGIVGFDATNGLEVGLSDIKILTPSAGVILISSGGTKYRITVADDGHLITTLVP